MNPPVPVRITESPTQRKVTAMKKLLASLTLGGAAAAAIAFAPAADAENSLNCDTRGMSSICSKNGHASIDASPDTRARSSAGYWPFGSGPVPPVFAMD